MAESVRPREKNKSWKGRRGPVVLLIMDGVGYGKYAEGDAVKASRMANLDWLTEHSPHTQLKAHGTAVGLPSDADMGNSEVGHNAMGCGRVFAQGAKLVSNAIAAGAMFQGGNLAEACFCSQGQQQHTSFHRSSFRRQRTFAPGSSQGYDCPGL